jgi:hypothetical protein
MANTGYVRNDENNDPVSSGDQPGYATTSYLGGTTGWSTVTHRDFNTDYIAYTYNSAAGIGTRTPSVYQRHDANNNPVGVGTYQRHDADNNPVTSP